MELREWSDGDYWVFTEDLLPALSMISSADAESCYSRNILNIVISPPQPAVFIDIRPQLPVSAIVLSLQLLTASNCLFHSLQIIPSERIPSS